MATGVIFTKAGKQAVINRAFKAAPDYLIPTCFKVGTGTTTPTAADSDLATAITIAGNPTKLFYTGYPLIDETNLQVTMRSVVATTECNSNTITEYGSFNKDASPKIFSRLVHTGIAKTSSIQIIYIEKNKIKQ